MKLDDRRREGPSGPRMILPGHLNDLLNVTLPGQVFLIDLRTPADFSRSHVQGAVNLRAPAAFLRNASLDLIEQAFDDDASKRIFGNWHFSKCIVFYSRGIESASECWAAEALAPRFRTWNWDGEVYLLKGHYREFSTSFSKHIEGTRMTEEARQRVEMLQKRTTTQKDMADAEALYKQWQGERWTEDQAGGPGASPTLDSERREVAERHEQDLEEEFEARFPELARRAREMYEPGDVMMRRYPEAQSIPVQDGLMSDYKAGMVEYLDRGLTKLRETGAAHPRGEAATGSSPGMMRAPGRSKLQDLQYYDLQHYERGAVGATPAATMTGVEAARKDSRASEEYVEISKGDAGGDATFVKAGASGELEGASSRRPAREKSRWWR